MIKLIPLITFVKEYGMKDKIKDFFSKKKNITIMATILAVVIVAIVLYFIFRRDDEFVLNPIYDVEPEEVQELYSGMSEVSCYGGWYLNIDVDNEKNIDIQDIDNNLLIDYVFNYMDKKGLLEDEFELDLFEDAVDLLFFEELDLTDIIDEYSYGGYSYTKKNRMITRKKNECVSNMNYVSQLSGYAFNEELLSVDVNIGYLKDGILYDIEDTKLGKYDGNPENIGFMFDASPYYRFNYVKIEDNFKLESVEFNIRYTG